MPDKSDLQVRDNPREHLFEVDLGDGSMALAAYVVQPGTIEFTHTQVPPAHEGKGVGSALIRAGLDAARERRLKVIPSCRFFAAYMKKHGETQDLLAPSARASLGLE